MSTLPSGTFSFQGKKREARASLEPIGKLFDRLPPHNVEAEMAFLGSLILDPKMIADVLTLVNRPEDFYLEKHGAIFAAVLDVYDRYHSGDLVQVVDLLKDQGKIDLVGGPEYLVQLAESVPAGVNAPHYARIVAEKARLRRLIDASGQILYEAYHSGDLGPEGAREILDRAEMAVFEIARQDETTDPQKLSDLLQQELERIEASEGKGFSGVPAGYYELDELLRGFQKGEMVVIAARPSMGKTALALNIAEQMALGGVAPGEVRGQPRPVALFSLEMSKSAVTQRLIAARSGVSTQALRGGQSLDKVYKKIVTACGELREAPIYVDDTPNMTALTLRARARRLVAQHGVQAIMVDYLQLLTAPGAARESRQVEVSAISRQVKALARELNVPVVCLSQLNRASEQREGNRPRMSDLRESGSIEQDADVIILLHREDYYHTQNPEWAIENPDKVGIAELIVAKQRNGPTGVVKLVWDSHITRFKNYDPYTAGGGASYESPAQAASNWPASRGGPGGPGGFTGGGAAAPPPEAPGAEPYRGFSPGRKAGPVDGFRDGGGPDAEEDIGDLPV
ncbi:MAG: replicative DNA helicase [Phycisphaerales bacterium]|nr:replicative DNA helicase [Phycisphaerales bacterium]